MVSKDGKESFCARCDGGEKVGLPRQGLVEPLATSLSSELNDQTRVSSPTSSGTGEDAAPDEHLYDFQEGRDTLPNTPPTPHSRLASPPPLPSVSVTLDPQVQSARRAQTDRASAQLAQKMLQGWTLLGEECSNESCHSVPLMRRPPVKLAKKDGEDNAPVTKLLDPRRYCVICQGDYVREGDLQAYEDFMAAVTGSRPSTSAAMGAPSKRQEGDNADQIIHTAAAKKRRFSTQPPTSQLDTSRVMGFGNASTDRKGKSRLIATGGTSVKPTVTTPARQIGSLQSDNLTKSLHPKEPETIGSGSSRSNITDNPVSSLEEAVKKLSRHLAYLCEDVGDINPAHIADAAEALSRTCKSLKDVKLLYA